jgi:DNA-binding transcriptional MerR regulator
VEDLWTLQELVAQVATRIAALPAPRNGQIRAIPDDRTVRYYATIGLLDRPSAMRGRTALYGSRHVAQVVAIKRLQAMGRSLSEIQTLWPTLDVPTLARMSGVALEATGSAPARAKFWKREPARIEPAHGEPSESSDPSESGSPDEPDEPIELNEPSDAPEARRDALDLAAIELRIALAPQVVLSLSIADDSVALSPADVRALRAAAAPLLAELASRRIAPHPSGEEP